MIQRYVIHFRAGNLTNKKIDGFLRRDDSSKHGHMSTVPAAVAMSASLQMTECWHPNLNGDEVLSTARCFFPRRSLRWQLGPRNAECGTWETESVRSPLRRGFRPAALAEDPRTGNSHEPGKLL